LVPSLVPLRHGKERWDHRLLGIDPADTGTIMERLRVVLSSKPASHNGVDWYTLIRAIVQHYSDRLEMVEHILNTTDSSNALVNAKKLQVQLRILLVPYILHSVQPPAESDTISNHSWAIPVWQRCATHYTAQIHRSPTALSPSETLLLSSIDFTTREICRVVVGMWAAGVVSGLDLPLPFHPSTEIELILPELLRKWSADTSSLMRWLDWSVWIKCRPACGYEVRF
jgi:hypothetical protein